MLYETGSTFIVVPLKNLGAQHAQVAAELKPTRLTSIAVTRENLTSDLLKV